MISDHYKEKVGISRHGWREAFVTMLMKRTPVLIITMLIASVGLPGYAADQSGPQKRPTQQKRQPPQVQPAETVEETVARIVSALEQQKFTIPLVVNHAAAARSVSLDLRPTQVIYARPPITVENRLTLRSSSIGIDLPLKYLVFENEAGDVEIRSNSIGYLIDRHGLTTNRTLDYLDSIIEIAGKPDNGLIVETSNMSVNDAYDAIKSAITAIPAFRVPLEIQYRQRKGRSVARLIVFGNPNAGTPLMQSTQEVALDLPQEILVVGGRKGKTQIIYNDPVYIANRHNLTGHDARLMAISGALANFAAAGK